jgi:hypothetical protein
VRGKLGLKHHWAVADYLQRSARHIASKTDLEQSYAVGKAAVELAVKGESGLMPTIVRVSQKPYKWKIGTAKLTDVANVEKKMPRDFITPDGFHITDKCRRYLEPLIAGEAFPPFEKGLPDLRPPQERRREEEDEQRFLAQITAFNRTQRRQGETQMLNDAILFSLVCGVIALVYGGITASWILKQPDGMTACAKSRTRSRSAPRPTSTASTRRSRSSAWCCWCCSASCSDGTPRSASSSARSPRARRATSA